MKIKIIEPYSPNRRHDIRSLTPSLGPVVIGTLLKNEGYDVEVISEYVTKIDPRDLAQADLIGISLATYNAIRGYEIARQARGPVLFGGFHASLLPEECLQYGDYVIRGDGHSVIDLVKFLDKRQGPEINEIPNLVYRHNGKIVYNREETRLINMIPDFNVVRNYYKLSLNRLLRIPLLVNGSRGCHHDCTFCCVKQVYKDVTKKDKSIILKDIQSQTTNSHFLSKWLPRIIWITDDNFFSDRLWAKEVLIELGKLKTGFELVLQARVDIGYDDEMLSLLRKAGVSLLCLGIESLNQKSLDAFHKGTSIGDIGYAVKKIQSYGIDIFGLFVFGDDEFKKGDGKRIAEFAIEQKFYGVLIQPLTPFPGTELFSLMKRSNRILNENWNDYAGKVVFLPKHMSPSELQREIYECYRKVYSFARILNRLVFGRKGFRLQFLGESIIRWVESVRSGKYVRECLQNQKNTELV